MDHFILSLFGLSIGVYIYAQFWNVYLGKKNKTKRDVTLCCQWLFKGIVHSTIVVYSFSFNSKPIWLTFFCGTWKETINCIWKWEAVKFDCHFWNFNISSLCFTEDVTSYWFGVNDEGIFVFRWIIPLSIQKIWELLLFKGQSLLKITDRS